MDNFSYTNNLAYSGPLSLKLDSLPSFDIDIFGLSDFKMRQPKKTPLLAQQPEGSFLSFNGSVDCSVFGFQNIVSDAPAGLYRIIYTNGAFNCFNGDPNFFNYGLNTQFSGNDYNDLPSYRLWIRLNSDPFQMYYFDEAFRNPGFATASDAMNAAIGTGFVFYHPGGPIDGIVDDEQYFFADNIGTIQVYIDNAVCQGPGVPTPGPRSGFWSIIWSSLEDKGLWPGVWDQGEVLPRVGNLYPGVHIMRYQLDLVDDGCPWYQDVYIRVWAMPPRGSPSIFVDEFNRDIPRDFRYAMEDSHFPGQPSLFPVKPTKLIRPGAFQNPTRKSGSPEHQKPKYSGNEPERPESPIVFKKPTKLGPNELY